MKNHRVEWYIHYLLHKIALRILLLERESRQQL